jgi:8-oxo-dGTP diphosphatase
MAGTDRLGLGVACDVALLTVRRGQLAVLLVQRPDEPYRDQWALPGGFVTDDEELEVTAERTLADETGMHISHLEQLRTYGKPNRDPRARVVTVAYVAFTALDDDPANHPVGRSRFWAIDDLLIPELDQCDGLSLAFDHSLIVADAVERARAKLEYTTLASAFVDEPFTLGELRRVYEAVWGISLHEANFRRKVLGTPGFVEATGETAPTDGRPAQLYRRGNETRLWPPILRGA